MTRGGPGLPSPGPPRHPDGKALMFVRVRLPAADLLARRAARRSCRFPLAMLAVSVAGLAATLASVLCGPGMYIAEVHTRVPALVVAAVLALGAQAAAVAVCYRDELQRQRRRRAVSA